MLQVSPQLLLLLHPRSWSDIPASWSHLLALRLSGSAAACSFQVSGCGTGPLGTQMPPPVAGQLLGCACLGKSFMQ